MDPVRELPFIRHANAYHTFFKTCKDLKQIFRSQDEAPVIIGLHEGARSSLKVGADLHGVDGIRDVTFEDGSITATITQAALYKVEALDDVKLIEYRPELSFANDQARQLVKVHQPVSSTNHTSTFDGTGQVVTVADSGFDVGTADPADIHPAFAHCTVNLRTVGRPKAGIPASRPESDQVDDPHGHGTHVAGSVVGNHTSSDLAGAPATDGTSPPTIAIQGTATGAELLFQSLLTGSPGRLTMVNPDVASVLFKVAYDAPHHPRIHSNSYIMVVRGSTDPSIPHTYSGPLRYYQHCDKIDDFIHENQDFVALFAAGNDARKAFDDAGNIIYPAQIGGLASSKNVITVGATESKRRYSKGSWALSRHTHAAYVCSSKGSTVEGRKKPDVVAPGTYIVSAKSRKSTSSEVWADSHHCQTRIGLASAVRAWRLRSPQAASP